MRRKLASLLVGMLSVSAIGVGAAYAADVSVVAVVDSTTVLGTRSITTVPQSLTMNSASSTSVTGSLGVAVTELAMPGPTGGNPWSVTAKLAGNLIKGSDSIESSNMTLSPNSSLSNETNPDASVSMAVGSANQSLAHTGGAATLFSVSGEATDKLYSGVYTGAGALSLTIPSGTSTGNYTATMTVTLLQ